VIGHRSAGERGAYQIAFAVRAPVLRGGVDELRRVLEDMAVWGDAGTARVPFARLSGVHFARLLLLEDVHDLDDELIPASLVLESDVDAPLERHVDELADAEGHTLDATLGLCEGYPAAPTAAARKAFLLGHRLNPEARYVNVVGRTLAQIQQEEKLRQAIEGFLDAHRDELPHDPRRARVAIQQFVENDPSLAWARQRAPKPALCRRLGELLHAIGVPAGLVIVAPLLIVVVPIAALILRFHEARDSATHRRPDGEHARRLGAIEDFAAQNQYSSMGFVKRGRFRRELTRIVLLATDYATRHVYTRADLAGIKSIHFARWTVLDERRRGIFTSSYDGSHESYMDDFVDKIAWGLNASFSHVVNWPRTRWLFFDGAKREEEFKDYQRLHQIPTQVWYSAYDQLSALNLDNNALIRSGLFGDMSAADAAAWLRRL
jgi:hypothetical protein